MVKYAIGGGIMLRGGIVLKLLVIFQFFVCLFAFAVVEEESEQLDGSILEGVWEHKCIKVNDDRYYNSKIAISGNIAIYSWKYHWHAGCPKMSLMDRGWTSVRFTLSEAGEVKNKDEAKVFNMDGLFFDAHDFHKPVLRCPGNSDIFGVEETAEGERFFYVGKVPEGFTGCYSPHTRPVELNRDIGPHVYKGPITGHIFYYMRALQEEFSIPIEEIFLEGWYGDTSRMD